ncbi:SEN1 N terminal-domain-containing protein [Phellopilus nigrolimitatus]|nr:SEN1 N terminal-domain-containing protein [Phellopilus nigrolimitatus]
MRIKPGRDGVLHWFCPQAEALTRELAVFLLRLFAYTNEKVVEWRARIKVVWHGCADFTFGAFSEITLTRFWAAFEAFEVESIVQALTDADITPDSNKSLADVPSPLLYHVLSKTAAFKNVFILKVITSQPFLPRAIDWPMDPPPPGYLLLLLHTDKEIRSWVTEHALKAKPISQESFNGNHEAALQAVSSLAKELCSVFPFGNNQRDIWASLAYVVHLLPSQKVEAYGIHRIILGHLHDSDSHFPEVLRCMLQIMKKLGNKLWSDESADYPQVVFDAIKDNPSYIKMITEFDPRKEKPWFLFMFLEFLRSVWDMQIFGDIIAKFAAFACDELQHERFAEKRPFVMDAAVQVLTKASARAIHYKAPSHYQVVVNVLDIHSDLIVAVAFSRSYDKSEWALARQSALALFRTVLTSDIDNAADAVVKLSAMEPTVETEEVAKFIPPPIRRQLWKKVYGSVSDKDVAGISSAKLDRLSKRSASRSIWKHLREGKSAPPKELLETVDSVVDGGFLDSVTKFANNNSSKVLLNALRRDNFVKHLVIMMLSPIEDLNVAAQTVIGQAYDVDVRVDCFREILRAMPGPSFDGLYSYLSQFNDYALKVTEATSASRALVRCMTDVIEVLGNSPDGLLKDAAYVKENTKGSFSLKSELPKLWKAMTTSIAVIFRGCPSWAVYFDNKIMSETLVLASPRKKTTSGKKMVGELQGVLTELQKWLRLTDTELLYQSFALLKSIFQCFNETDVKPSADALAKLSRFIDANKDTQDKKRVSFLNQADLAELELAIANFNDDEVEIISVDLKPKTKLKTKRRRDSSPEVIGVAAPAKARTEKHLPHLSKEAKKSSKQTKLQFPNKTSATSSIGQKRPVQQPIASTSTYIKRPVREPKFEGSSIHHPASRSATADSSSSSDSDDADEDGARGLNILVNYQKKELEKLKFAKQAPERRRIKLIEDPMINGRNAQQERMTQREIAHRNKMRLKPNIMPLHRTILCWNYDHEGSEPPFTGSTPGLVRVPDSFMDHEQYLRIFEPLLMLECWSQINKSKEETAPEIYRCRIAGRSFTDDWLDLDVLIGEGARKDWRLTPETDIVLLRHITEKTSIMAKVLLFRNTFTGIQISLRCCVKAHSSDPGLSINSTWLLSSVFSLSTLHREFAALMALPYYDMADIILRPRLTDPVIASSDDIQQAIDAYQVNKPQAKAIISSMRTKGFSLIQGPPGTGKTWTICGLVGAFLSSRRAAPTPIIAGKKAEPAQPAQKILLCAPSNAAIDEVAKRLIEGVRGSRGQRLTPKVVRVGAEAQVNVSVKEISLDTLVTEKLDADGNKGLRDGGGEVASLRAEIDSVKEQRQMKAEEMQATSNNASRVLALEEEVKVLNAKRIALSQRLDRLKDTQKSQNRSLDAIRRKYRYDVLSEADVICSTLSGSGHEQLENFDFSMVIIDEAAQAIELSSLIPLKYQSTQCIMVGDPQQLPPTVLSSEASKWGYDQSLFVRMQKQRPSAVHLLSIQYRMHPEISRLPSRIFYEGRLHDGPDMDKKTAQPWHVEPKFGVYKFFSVTQGREEPGRIGHSLINREECKVVAAIYDRLRKQFPSVDFDYRIGIVSMYRAQVQELRRAFQQRFGFEILGKVDFNTVDGFQGQEKDIIILSCVRAGPSLSKIGFLADIRRMNVAITRSKSSLFIVGHGPTLQRSNETWRDIIEDARTRSCLIEPTDTSYFTKNVVSNATPAQNGWRAPEVQPPPPSKKQEVALDNPLPELFAPTSMKRPKITRDRYTVSHDMPSNQPNILGGQKRAHEDGHERRPPPNERNSGNQFGAGEASSSTGPNRPMPQDKGQAPSAIKKDSDAERAAALKSLEALRKHKKQANNLFIKR